MQPNDWKARLGMVYSTNPDFAFETDEPQESDTLPPNQQRLHVRFERAGRKGKTVTLVENFVGTTTDLQALAKLLKTRVGVGGSSSDGQILLQGEHVEKVKTILRSEGYKV